MSNTPRFVSVKEVRQISGITSGEIDDDDISDMISDKEIEMEKRLNTVFSPQVRIDRLDGNNRATIFTKRSPLLALRAITSNSTDITISNTYFESSGRIRLATNAEQGIFARYPQVRDSVFVKYVIGDIEFPTYGGVETTTDADASLGTSVAISVADSTNFKVDDWVRIEGMDGNIEAAQITAKDTGEITVDEILYDHESGSLVRKLELPKQIKEYIKLEVALILFGREVGQSFDDITGYSLSELQVQKGEPFTQWREAYRQNIERWKTLGKSVRRRIALRVR